MSIENEISVPYKVIQKKVSSSMGIRNNRQKHLIYNLCRFGYEKILTTTTIYWVGLGTANCKNK